MEVSFTRLGPQQVSFRPVHTRTLAQHQRLQPQHRESRGEEIAGRMVDAEVEAEAIRASIGNRPVIRNATTG